MNILVTNALAPIMLPSPIVIRDILAPAPINTLSLIVGPFIRFSSYPFMPILLSFDVDTYKLINTLFPQPCYLYIRMTHDFRFISYT